MSRGTELQYYLRVAKRRLGYFAIPLLLVLGIGTGVVMYLPAIYNSSATILVESQQIPDQFVQSTVTALATERLQVIQQRVMTRENLLRIADKFALFSDRKSLSKTDLVDLMRSRVTFTMLDVGTSSKKKKTDNLTVAFAIGFDYERPRESADVANELVTLVLNEDIQNRANRATETTQFITRESERLAAELKDLEATIAQFKLQNSATLPEKLSFNMSLLEKRQKSIEDIDRGILAAEEQKRQLEFEARIKGSQAPAAQGGSKSGMTLEQKLAELQNAYTTRAIIYSDNHPEMRALRKQIVLAQEANEKAKLEAAKANPVSTDDDPSLTVEQRLLAQKIDTIDRSVATLKKQRVSMEESIASLQAVVEKSPEVGAQLLSLERRRDSLQRNSDDMATKLSRAKLGERLEENQQAERFEVIESPIVPQEPVRPKRLPLIFLAIGASLAAGSATAMGAEFLDTTVKRSSDLTDKLNKRLLVSIPYIRTNGEQRRLRLSVVIAFILALLAVAGGLVALHYFYMPLDILMLRVQRLFQSAF